MYFVYVLRSNKDGNLYVGYSTDVKRRLGEHRRGNVLSTKNRRLLKLIFLEMYINIGHAVRREKYLKTYVGKKMLKAMLRNILKENV